MRSVHTMTPNKPPLPPAVPLPVALPGPVVKLELELLVIIAFVIIVVGVEPLVVCEAVDKDCV